MKNKKVVRPEDAEQVLRDCTVSGDFENTYFENCHFEGSGRLINCSLNWTRGCTDYEFVSCYMGQGNWLNGNFAETPR